MRHLFKKRILGVEFDFPRLRIAELEPGDPLRLVHFAQIDYEFFSPPELAKLIRNQFRGRRIALTAPLTTAAHHLETFPLEPEELENVIPSEARRVAMLDPEDLLFDYEIVGESRSPEGGPLLEVLIVTASRSEVQKRTAFFREHGFQIDRFTTVPIALLNGFRKETHRWGEEAVLAFHLGHGAVNMLAARNGKLLFCVENSLELSDFPGNEVAHLSLLIGEIKRGFMYFSQRFRGSQVQRIVLSGAGDLRKLTGPLTDAFGVEVQLFDPSGWVDLSRIPEGGDSWEEKEMRSELPTLAAALGAVLHAPPSLQVDLREAGGRRLGVSASKPVLVAALCLLLLLAAATFYLHRTRGQLQEQVETLATQAETIQERLERAYSALETRNQEATEEAALQALRLSGPVLSAVLKSLSLAAPPDLKLTGLQARPAGRRWELTLQGEVLTEDAAAANLQFSRFMDQLLSDPLVRQHAFLKPIETTTLDLPSPPGEASDSTASEERRSLTRLTFDLSLLVG